MPARDPATNSKEINRITGGIIGAGIEVHRALGPGLLESVYEACLIYELQRVGFSIESQKPVPVCYKDVTLDCGYRLDVVVDGQVIVEVKSVSGLSAIHDAQLLSYLRLSGCSLGLLINFNVKLLKDGIRRLRN